MVGGDQNRLWGIPPQPTFLKFALYIHQNLIRNKDVGRCVYKSLRFIYLSLRPTYYPDTTGSPVLCRFLARCRMLLSGFLRFGDPDTRLCAENRLFFAHRGSGPDYRNYARKQMQYAWVKLSEITDLRNAGFGPFFASMAHREMNPRGPVWWISRGVVRRRKVLQQEQPPSNLAFRIRNVT